MGGFGSGHVGVDAKDGVHPGQRHDFCHGTLQACQFKFPTRTQEFLGRHNRPKAA